MLRLTLLDAVRASCYGFAWVRPACHVELDPPHYVGLAILRLRVVSPPTTLLEDILLTTHQEDRSRVLLQLSVRSRSYACFLSQALGGLRDLDDGDLEQLACALQRVEDLVRSLDRLAGELLTGER